MREAMCGVEPPVCRDLSACTEATGYYRSQKALEHAWLKKASESLKRKRQSTYKNGRALVQQESVALERMTQFARTDALQKAAMMLIVHELHQDEIDKLRTIFYELDKNNDGEITWKEMKDGFLDARVSLPEEEVHSLFDSILGANDADPKFSDNDVIPYSFFLAATMDHHVLRNKARLREVRLFCFCGILPRGHFARPHQNHLPFQSHPQQLPLSQTMSCNNIPTRLRYLPGHAGVPSLRSR